jgi:hypothetical protein
MGKLKNYDCHKQKYYVPQNKPSWSILNLKQAAKKIDKEKAASKKQALGKKKKIAQKLANRKGGRGLRNPANPEHKKILAKVRRVDGRLEPRLDARNRRRTNRIASRRQPPTDRFRPRPPRPIPARPVLLRVLLADDDFLLLPPPRALAVEATEEEQALRKSQRAQQLSVDVISPPRAHIRFQHLESFVRPLERLI